MKLSELPNHWAVVTGASAGIGAEFARQLAALKWNIVLVARRAELETFAKDLAKEFGVDAIAIKADLSEPDAAKKLREALDEKKIRIRLLCNNAAAGYMGRFEQSTVENYQKILLLNNTCIVAMCMEFRQHLIQYPSSAIINVSSQAAYQPVPYMAIYAASKAFLHSFSQSLYHEWQNDGIHVQTLVPGPTATEFDRKSSTYQTKLQTRDDPSIVVRKSIEGLGYGPIISSARGLLKQRILSALVPPKILLREVAKLFRPPD